MRRLRRHTNTAAASIPLVLRRRRRRTLTSHTPRSRTANKRDALDVAHPLEVVVLLGDALEAVHRRVALFRGDARLPLQPRILLQQRAHADVGDEYKATLCLAALGFAARSRATVYTALSIKEHMLNTYLASEAPPKDNWRSYNTVSTVSLARPNLNPRPTSPAP